MKKIIIITLVLLLTTHLFSQEKDFSLSNVNSSSGKFVFYNLEPFDTYTKAFYFENKLPEDENTPLKTIMAKSIANAMKESGLQGGEPFDAVIITDGEPRAKAIKFTTISKNNSLAKIGFVKLGVYIFVGSMPSNEHDYIATINVRYHTKPEQREKAFLEIIERSKKKYPNFDGLIFKDDLLSADLIKFRGLEISGGGFRVGDKAIFSSGSKPKYGEIVQLDNTKQSASFKFYDEYGDERVKAIEYSKLSPISNEQYGNFITKQNIEIEKHKFSNGEKVCWTEGKDPMYGEVVSLNNKSHDATIKSLNKYGEDKTTTVDFLKVDKLDDTKFQELRKRELEEIKKHQFEIGQKVSFINDKKSKCGEVVGLNNKNHTATIKYLGVFAEDKTTQEEYFDIEKISDEKYAEEVTKYREEAKKYSFAAGEKVVWTKENILGIKSESINAEVVSLNDSEHKATIKYTKDNIEKQETTSYLNLTKIKTTP